ncbi:MAG: hypothetical protein U9Q07_14170 [Planctomycetota bacterium]|nr:hypothetical protein [Planctomycetota bacterium]
MALDTAFFPAIMRAIVETGYTGYMVRDTPLLDPMESLVQAMKACDV